MRPHSSVRRHRAPVLTAAVVRHVHAVPCSLIPNDCDPGCPNSSQSSSHTKKKNWSCRLQSTRLYKDPVAAYCAATHSYAICVVRVLYLATCGPQQQSRSYSWEPPRPVPLPVHPPVAARSTHLATPRTISTPIRCRQCPPQVIEDQWARSPTPWFFHFATAVHSRKNSSASRPIAPPT